ncbi:hypothetical protein [Cecembia lonarensis]|uniref:Uncharacterized protein n=1 Tax=Cecembia lonarensis (strain CCUG 58316 / KCTC 22772 / LW9) TaxID=1225176 RepID=K1LI38_CECL9|nr:hypothetical protein [Cecembia lonarensis]EKB49943.1 hypothetical protein B879_01368 [Cecembia lonarensis LW9]
MFKRTLHILLALLILINGMGYSVIQADFYIYQDKIAALFCINKDKPELACDGKCELERRLDEAQETEENKRRAVQEEVTWVYLKPEVKSALDQYWKHYHPVFGVLDEKPEILLSIKDFFHPPQA